MGDKPPARREQALTDEPIRLVPYDPTWPAQFSKERKLLEEALGDLVVGGIHHVGSTAVPGLEAKPVVDVLVGVRSLETGRACFGPLALLSYVHAPYRTAEMHWFCKPHPSRRTHHLHVVPFDSRRFRDELAFRDHLIGHPDDAAAYASLKRRLAKQFRHNRDRYSDAKSQFIEQCLRAK